MSFAVTLKSLPGISHLVAMHLFATDGTLAGTIENKTGQMGSLAVYNHLAQLYGAMTPEAAKKGLELFGEHSIDARLNPGKHPHIDRLIGLIERNETLRVKQQFAM
jgi:hypothetical protein